MNPPSLDQAFQMIREGQEPLVGGAVEARTAGGSRGRGTVGNPAGVGGRDAQKLALAQASAHASAAESKTAGSLWERRQEEVRLAEAQAVPRKPTPLMLPVSDSDNETDKESEIDGKRGLRHHAGSGRGASRGVGAGLGLGSGGGWVTGMGDWLSDLPLEGLKRGVDSHLRTATAMRDTHRFIEILTD